MIPSFYVKDITKLQKRLCEEGYLNNTIDTPFDNDYYICNNWIGEYHISKSEQNRFLSQNHAVSFSNAEILHMLKTVLPLQYCANKQTFQLYQQEFSSADELRWYLRCQGLGPKASQAGLEADKLLALRYWCAEALHPDVICLLQDYNDANESTRSTETEKTIWNPKVLSDKDIKNRVHICSTSRCKKVACVCWTSGKNGQNWYGCKDCTMKEFDFSVLTMEGVTKKKENLIRKYCMEGNVDDLSLSSKKTEAHTQTEKKKRNFLPSATSICSNASTITYSLPRPLSDYPPTLQNLFEEYPPSEFLSTDCSWAYMLRMLRSKYGFYYKQISSLLEMQTGVPHVYVPPSTTWIPVVQAEKDSNGFVESFTSKDGHIFKRSVDWFTEDDLKLWARDWLAWNDNDSSVSTKKRTQSKEKKHIKAKHDGNENSITKKSKKEASDVKSYLSHTKNNKVSDGNSPTGMSMRSYTSEASEIYSLPRPLSDYSQTLQSLFEEHPPSNFLATDCSWVYLLRTLKAKYGFYYRRIPSSLEMQTGIDYVYIPKEITWLQITSASIDDDNNVAAFVTKDDIIYKRHVEWFTEDDLKQWSRVWLGWGNDNSGAPREKRRTSDKRKLKGKQFKEVPISKSRKYIKNDSALSVSPNTSESRSSTRKIEAPEGKKSSTKSSPAQSEISVTYSLPRPLSDYPPTLQNLFEEYPPSEFLSTDCSWAYMLRMLRSKYGFYYKQISSLLEMQTGVPHVYVPPSTTWIPVVQAEKDSNGFVESFTSKDGHIFKRSVDWFTEDDLKLWARDWLAWGSVIRNIPQEKRRMQKKRTMDCEIKLPEQRKKQKDMKTLSTDEKSTPHSLQKTFGTVDPLIQDAIKRMELIDPNQSEGPIKPTDAWPKCLSKLEFIGWTVVPHKGKHGLSTSGYFFLIPGLESKNDKRCIEGVHLLEEDGLKEFCRKYHGWDESIKSSRFTSPTSSKRMNRDRTSSCKKRSSMSAKRVRSISSDISGEDLSECSDKSWSIQDVLEKTRAQLQCRNDTVYSDVQTSTVEKLNETLSEWTSSLGCCSSNQLPSSLFVCGNPGVGKTTCVERSLTFLQQANPDKVVFTILNGAQLTGSQNLETYVAEELAKIVKLNTSKSINLNEVETRLSSTSGYFAKRHCILVIDEVDMLVQKNRVSTKAAKLLYTLLRWASDQKLRFSWIGIGNEVKFLHNCLPDLWTANYTNSVPATIVFPTYTKEQLEKILLDRVGGSDNIVFSSSSIRLIAKRISMNKGDARRAFDLASSAITNCIELMHEKERRAKANGADCNDTSSCQSITCFVQPKHVLNVVKENPKSKSVIETIEVQPLWGKAILCIAVTLKRALFEQGIESKITLGVFESYCKAAMYSNIVNEDLPTEDIYDVLTNLSDAGLIMLGNKDMQQSFDSRSTEIDLSVQLDDVEVALGEMMLRGPCANFFSGMAKSVVENVERNGRLIV